MGSIKIFLASSLVELADDRIALTADFVELQNKYAYRNIADLRLVRAEEISDQYVSGGKQSKLNEEIITSDAVFFLFGKKLGEQTMAELRLAEEHYRETGAPKIFICRKQIDEAESSLDELDNFLKTNNQYWIEYSSTAEVFKRIRDAVDEIAYEKGYTASVSSLETPIHKAKTASIFPITLVGIAILLAVLLAFFLLRDRENANTNLAMLENTKAETAEESQEQLLPDNGIYVSNDHSVELVVRGQEAALTLYESGVIAKRYRCHIAENGDVSASYLIEYENGELLTGFPIEKSSSLRLLGKVILTNTSDGTISLVVADEVVGQIDLFRQGSDNGKDAWLQVLEEFEHVKESADS